jgi:hypothetical protein
MSECDPYSQQKNEKYHSHTRQWADISSKIALQSIYQLKDTKSLHHSQGSE